MSVARFQAISVATRDPATVGRFWSGVLDRPWDPASGELAGGPGEAPLLFCSAAGPTAVKNRVHLDIYTAGLDGLGALGARLYEPAGEGHRWTVMRDPDDAVFCAFVRAEPPLPRLHGVVVDCTDHQAQARFWVALLGGAVEVHESGYSTAMDVPGMTFTLDFVPVPEPKTAPNRLRCVLRAEAIEPLVALGARLIEEPGSPGRPWVLGDPEGNEFHVVLGPPSPTDPVAGGSAG